MTTPLSTFGFLLGEARRGHEPALSKAASMSAAASMLGFAGAFGFDFPGAAPKVLGLVIWVAGMVAPWVQAWRTRKLTTSTKRPRDDQGRDLVPADPVAEVDPLAPIGGAVAGVGVIADDTLDVTGDAVRGVTGVLGGLLGGRGRRRKP